MPRELALLLCTGFVLLLLRLERKESGEVSAAAWIPTVWMLAISSKPLGVWFSTGGSAESGSPLDRMLLAGLVVAAVPVIAYRRVDWSKVLGQNRWLLALLAYMLASTLWSDISNLSFKRWTRDAIVVIMALAIISEPNPRQALESVLRRCAYVLVPFSILLAKYYPALGREYARWSGSEMWTGVTQQKNSLGRLCLVCGFFLVWAMVRQWRESAGDETRPALRGATQKQTSPLRNLWWGDAGVLLLALYLLKGAEGAYSATSIGTLALGLTTFICLMWLRQAGVALLRFAVPAVLLSLLVFGATAPFVGGSSIAGLSSIFGRDETLTGRTETWGQLVPIVKQHPLLGSGHGSFWTTERREFYRMSHGHNGYLDILLDLGSLGLAIYFAWLAACALKAHAAREQDHYWASLATSLLLMAAVYNTTESALNSLSDQMTAVIVLTSVVVPYESTCAADRQDRRLRVHVPPEPATGAAAEERGAATNRRLVPVLSGGSGQRRGRGRSGSGRPGSKRDGA
jgi:O-antigen ligase